MSKFIKSLFGLLVIASLAGCAEMMAGLTQIGTSAVAINNVVAPIVTKLNSNGNVPQLQPGQSYTSTTITAAPQTIQNGGQSNVK